MTERYNSKRSTKRKHSKRSKALLAAACAGSLMSGMSASAQTATEADFGGDFGNTLLDASTLPIGTTEVTGNLQSPDSNDFVKFSNLLPGSPFSLEYQRNIGSAQFSILNSAGDLLDRSFGNGTFDGSVPADGMLISQISLVEGGSDAYSLSLDAAAVPEPSAIGLLAAAAGAGAAGRRRKKSVE